MSSYSFTKLFSTITDSSIWAADSDTRVVWVTMLAMADRNGRVFAALPGLSNRARVSIEATEAAIAQFLAPDKYSRSPVSEGRRIEVIEGGWRLLNYCKYREMRDAEGDRERKRTWATNRRNLSKVARRRTKSPQAEAEAEAEADIAGDPAKGVQGENCFTNRPSLEDVLFHAAKIGLAEWKATDWFNEMETVGWLDYRGRQVVKWVPMLARVRSKWEADGRPKGPPASKSAGSPEPPDGFLRSEQAKAADRFIEKLEKDLKQQGIE